MRSTAGWFVGMIVIFAVSFRARADIAPPDACTAPGQPCSNAGASHNQVGSCTTTTCSRVMPLSDGGTMITTYSCNLCQVSGAGGAAGSGGSGAGDSGTDAATTPAKSSGCAIGGRAGISSLAGPLALAGLLVMVGRRRGRRIR
jgi:hypothetical protein